MSPREDRELSLCDINAAINDTFDKEAKKRDFRVLLLCMMAAAYEDIKDL